MGCISKASIGCRKGSVVKGVVLVGILILILTACETAQTRREQYVRSHDNLDKSIREAVLSGKVIIGMKKEQVLASWGPPLRINKKGDAAEFDEQWIYYGATGSLPKCPVVFLNFKKGRVVGWGECGS